MGGFGSGNWWERFDKKSTVEQSLVIAVGQFFGRGRAKCSGTLTWTWTLGRQCSVGYVVKWDWAEPTVTLHYRWRDNEDIRISIRMQTTPTQFGGQRWWFTCPLIVGGVACNRRVGKLYSPPGARYFGCRQCYDLTYQSSQEARSDERFFARVAETRRYLATMKSQELID